MPCNILLSGVIFIVGQTYGQKHYDTEFGISIQRPYVYSLVFTTGDQSTRKYDEQNSINRTSKIRYHYTVSSCFGKSSCFDKEEKKSIYVLLL